MTTRPERVIPHRAVLAALFVVYVLTRYPDVGGRINMGDSAKFQFLARTLGIGHAPGNPLYLMLSALWVRLPLPLSDATQITLLSSACGLLTVALVSRAVGVLELPRLGLRGVALEARSLAALLLGLGSLFWTLSTEAEVYTLATVFVAGVVLGMARWTKDHEPRALYFAIGSLGLGVGNHLSIAALGPAVLYALLSDKEGIAALRTAKLWLVAAAALGLGVLSYGWIAWRISKAPLVYSELAAPFAWPAFLRFVTARGVIGATGSMPTLASTMTERLPSLFEQLQKQWPWPLLLFLPVGWLRLVELRKTFANFLAHGVLGFFGIALVFRIPDPEGLFLPVSVLLCAVLAAAASSTRAGVVMLVVHGALVAAHGVSWYREPYSAYVQQTPEGKVVVNLPTLHEAAPENAMIAVPCGHYGCVEITTYYALIDRPLRDRGISFVRFSWSEWDDGKFPVPVVDPKKEKTRPICVLLATDVAKLKELGLNPTPIPRASVQVHGRRFTSPPLHCVRP